MKKNNSIEYQKTILTKFLNGENVDESDNEEVVSLLVEHQINEIIFNTLISGIVVKEQLDLYKKLIEYCESDIYKVFEEYESIIEVDEAISIVKDIEEGKEFSKDGYGRELQIISSDLFEEEKVYLIKEYNKLFRVIKGKDYNEYFKGFTDRIKVSDKIMFISDDFQDADEGISLTLTGEKINKSYHPLGVNLKGPVVITGIDCNNDWDGTRSLAIDEVMYILSHRHEWGCSVIDIDYFFNEI